MVGKTVLDTPFKFSDFGGSTERFLRFPDETDPNWCATNPSIGYSEEYGYAVMVRSTNYLISDETLYIYGLTVGNVISNRMWFSELDNELSLTNLREVKFIHSPHLPVVRGIEDPRLFSRRGEWFISGVMLEDEHTPRARICIYRFNPESSIAEFVAKYDSWDPHNLEKNWMVVATEYSHEFDFIYSSTGIVKDGVFILQPHSSSLLSSLRGGSCLWPLGDGTYLAVTHEVDHSKADYYNKNTFSHQVVSIRKYSHRFARYSSSGKLLQLSDNFYFEKYGVEFVSGMVIKNDTVVISYGFMDSHACFASIPLDTALQMLKDIV